MTDSDTHIYATPEDPDPPCAVCDRPFDGDEWIETSHGGDAWGGVARYDCPTDDCPGTCSFQY